MYKSHAHHHAPIAKVHQHIAHHALVVNELNEISYECSETQGSSCIEGESCGCFNDYNEYFYYEPTFPIYNNAEN